MSKTINQTENKSGKKVSLNHAENILHRACHVITSLQPEYYQFKLKFSFLLVE